MDDKPGTNASHRSFVRGASRSPRGIDNVRSIFDGRHFTIVFGRFSSAASGRALVFIFHGPVRAASAAHPYARRLEAARRRQGHDEPPSHYRSARSVAAGGPDNQGPINFYTLALGKRRLVGHCTICTAASTRRLVHERPMHPRDRAPFDIRVPRVIAPATRAD